MSDAEWRQRTSCLLQRARAESGSTAAQMGAASHLGQRQVRRFLSGELMPRLDTLDALLRACGKELTLGIRKAEDDDGND